jgi:hypothetical protein
VLFEPFVLDKLDVSLDSIKHNYSNGVEAYAYAADI